MDLDLPEEAAPGEVMSESDEPGTIVVGDVPAIMRRPTPLISLKSEMARAMQVVADKERERIDAGVGDEETAHVARIHVRAAAEATQLRKHADEDVDLVNAWFDDQVKQLREAADHQIADRRQGLADSLTHHASLIDAEVQSVHAAVEGYRSSLDTFFGRLAAEPDPGVIARLAGTLPDLPELDSVRADARAQAMRDIAQKATTEDASTGAADQADGVGRFELERELVPVMDPAAVNQRVSILSGLGIPVGRPGPAALLGGQPAPSPAESYDDETTVPVETESASSTVAIPVIHAATIWNANSGDAQSQ